jgi:hypothetical protein
MKGNTTMPNNVYTFTYNELKNGIPVPAFAASDGLQTASVDTQTLNDLVPIAAFKGTSAGFPDGAGFRLYYNPGAKDVYLCKTNADGTPLTENGTVTLYDVFKNDVTIDYSMSYKIACNYNQFQIQKAQGEMVGDGDQNYFKLDSLFITDGHTDYDLLNNFTAADGTTKSTETTNETTSESESQTDATTEAKTEAETTSEPETETEAQTEAETETEAVTEAETQALTTVEVTDATPQQGGSSGFLIALVLFLAIFLAGVLTTCIILVRKLREGKNAAPDNSKFEKREKDYQDEIVRLAKENDRLKSELDNHRNNSDDE